MNGFDYLYFLKEKQPYWIAEEKNCQKEIE